MIQPRQPLIRLAMLVRIGLGLLQGGLGDSAILGLDGGDAESQPGLAGIARLTGGQRPAVGVDEGRLERSADRRRGLDTSTSTR